jgi:hypothetical protein
LEDGWWVNRGLNEAESGSGFEAVVTITKTVWLTKADLDPKFLRNFKA